MKSTISIALSVFAVTAAVATTAHAQQTPSPASPPPPAPPTAPMTTTTSTTAADTPIVTDTNAGPSAASPSEKDTVTVHRSIRPNRPWLITGGSILLGSYITTAVVTATQGREVEDRNLLVPVAGPWLNLGDRRCDGCDNETRNVALVIGSGVLQGVGALMTAASFFIPEKIEAATITAGPMKLHVLPTPMGRSGVGVGTVATF